MGSLLNAAVALGLLAPQRQLLEHRINRVQCVNLVDVRNLAIAYINALTAPGAANKHHLRQYLISTGYSLIDTGMVRKTSTYVSRTNANDCPPW
ncbi:hypothetical protein LSAT2_010968 [Lamellibrachia satsuma]|nr:hypothetical protein LSAT2_010968 [Lamellibrachia satsuma]